MLTIAEVNQRRPRCAKCGCTADLLDIQDAALRQELLGLLYAVEKNVADAQRYLREVGFP